MGNKPGYVPRGRSSQGATNPSGDTLQLLRIIVTSGNEIGDDLHVHAPFPLCPDGHLQNSLKMVQMGDFSVALLGESLYIDPKGIQIGPYQIQCLGCYKPIRDIVGLQPFFLGKSRAVQGVFKPKSRFIVGPGNPHTLVLPGQLKHLLR